MRLPTSPLSLLLSCPACPACPSRLSLALKPRFDEPWQLLHGEASILSSGTYMHISTRPELLPLLLARISYLIPTRLYMYKQAAYMYASACPSPPSTSPIHSSWRCPLASHEALVACSLPPMTLSGGATAPIGESATASGRVPSGSPLSVYEHSSWVSMERGLAEWLRLVVRFMLAAGLEASDHDLGRGAERRRLPFVVYLGSSSGLMCV